MASTARIRIVADADALADAAAERIAEATTAAVAARGRADLALAGGTTPRRAYERLAARHARGAAVLPWARIHLWWGDERCVPPDHAESNFGAAREALLDRVPLPPANVHRMRGDAPDPAAAARDYERELPAALDLLLLGVGPDGHTASLFPGSAALAESVRRVVDVVGPKPPPRRLTITPPVLRAARSVLVMAAGADKARAIARAQDAATSPAEVPAALLRDRDWLIDAAASAEIESTDRASIRSRTEEGRSRQ